MNEAITASRVQRALVRSPKPSSNLNRSPLFMCDFFFGEPFSSSGVNIISGGVGRSDGALFRRGKALAGIREGGDTCHSHGSHEKRKIIRWAIFLIVILAIGVLAALSVKVYPEEVTTISSDWNSPVSAPSINHEYGRCSLMIVLTQGYEFRPVVMDAEVLYSRNPNWGWWYLLIGPICIVFAGALCVCVWRLTQKIVPSLKRLRTTRLGVALLIYTVVSVLGHLVYYFHVWIGGMNRLPGMFAPVYGFLNSAICWLTLPCFIVNEAIIYGLNAANHFIYNHTFPHLAYPNVSPIHRFLGAYPGTPVAWELFNTGVLLCFWFLVLPSLVEWICRVMPFARRYFSTQSSDRKVV